MSDAINITGTTQVDKETFFSEFNNEVSKELDGLLNNLKNEEDRAIVKEISIKMISLYQGMYTVETDKERNSLQRQINNYKSAVASISARYQLDIANAIIKICKKASVMALSVAVSFVAL